MTGLEDAYGEESDFRDHVVGLGAANARTRAGALDRLWSCLCHQGSVYPASLAAVPLLVMRLGSRGQKDREEIIALLAGIAVGDHTNFLDGTLAGRRRLKPGGKSTEARCFTAVAKQAPTLRALLGDPDPRVRAASAFGLAWLPDTGGSAKQIETRAETERDATALASMLIALGHLGASKARAALVARLAATNQVVATGAAIGLFYLEGTKLPREAHAIFGEGIDFEGDAHETAVERGELAAHAGIVLAKLPARAAGPDGDTRKIIASLREMKFEQANAQVVRLLKALFKGRDAKAWSDLTNDQKALLRAIVADGLGTWRGDVDYALRARGLPWLEHLSKMTKTKPGRHPSFA